MGTDTGQIACAVIVAILATLTWYRPIIAGKKFTPVGFILADIIVFMSCIVYCATWIQHMIMNPLPNVMHSYVHLTVESALLSIVGSMYWVALQNITVKFKTLFEAAVNANHVDKILDKYGMDSKHLTEACQERHESFKALCESIRHKEQLIEDYIKLGVDQKTINRRKYQLREAKRLIALKLKAAELHTMERKLRTEKVSRRAVVIK